jgi:two-component system heavy metal sensor histidine kinase CusS
MFDVRKTRSVRFRLTVWYTAVLVAALALFSGLIWLTLRARLRAEIDEDLAREASKFETFVKAEAAEVPRSRLQEEIAEFSEALPASTFIEVRSSSGHVRFSYPEPARASHAKYRTVARGFQIDGEEFHFVMGTSLRSVGHTLELLEFLLLGLIPVTIAMAITGGVWLSGRALKPVDDITEAARTISIDSLSQRLKTLETGDELARLTEVWNTMLGRLEDAVKTLSQFAADASHELRTPLAVIRTSAELALRRAREPESYRQSLAQIADEAARMTSLVEDLLFLARTGAQAADMPKEPLDLRDLVREASAELREVAELRQVSVRVQPCMDTPRVSGNRPALRRLILVLLDNALKYSPPGSDVIAAVEHEAERVAVTIQDFGAGISDDDLPHIFKRFYQADKSRAGNIRAEKLRRDGGFGLGLSLAETIANAHGATIDVRSARGAGSTFRVTFYATAASWPADSSIIRTMALPKSSPVRPTA